jgi:hypothetical protein
MEEKLLNAPPEELDLPKSVEEKLLPAPKTHSILRIVLIIWMVILVLWGAYLLANFVLGIDPFSFFHHDLNTFPHCETGQNCPL